MTSGICRALYSVHSFKAVFDSLSGQQHSQLLPTLQGHNRFILLLHLYRPLVNGIDIWLMEFSGAISPECQSPLRGFFGILSFYLEWMDQLFRIFHRRLWGQIMFFMCNLYKSQDKNYMNLN